MARPELSVRARSLVVVRPASRDDLPATAHLHARWLPGGFFARLGTRFLRAYHDGFARSPAAVALVAERADGPVGFLVGTLDNERHYRWLARHRGIGLALTGAASLLRDPRLGREFLRTRALRYLRTVRRRLRPTPVTVTASSPAAEDPARPSARVAVLTHVAVAPQARGDGIGRSLVGTFVLRAREAGADEVRLISPVTASAPAFYRSLGWRSAGRRRASDGSQVEEFRLVL